MSAMPLLELKNVSKSHGKGALQTRVLRDINLSITAGELVAIVGYSGTGKTTLMSLLAGLSDSDRGQVLMRGQPICGTSAERGLVFQNYSLLPWLSVLDNVMFAVRQVFPKESFYDQLARAKKVIDLVKLSHALDKLPSELSGGMRQRVSLARTLVTEPAVLLLDEPLSALDALTRPTLQGEIVSICEKQRVTVCMITGDVDEALLIADRIIPLLPGGSQGATLGEPIQVPFPRPRLRSAVLQDPSLGRLKRQAIKALTDARQASLREEFGVATA
jgi:nitrate/nitrite transport system ATP-binding protein